MYRSTRMLALAAVFSALALADTWTGTLVDSDCIGTGKTGQECAPTSSTSAFALITADGKTFKLDEAGNAKAGDAVKNSADRAKDESAAKRALTAKVTGTSTEDKIQVESIELR